MLHGAPHTNVVTKAAQGPGGSSRSVEPGRASGQGSPGWSRGPAWPGACGTPLRCPSLLPQQGQMTASESDSRDTVSPSGLFCPSRSHTCTHRRGLPWMTQGGQGLAQGQLAIGGSQSWVCLPGPRVTFTHRAMGLDSVSLTGFPRSHVDPPVLHCLLGPWPPAAHLQRHPLCLAGALLDAVNALGPGQGLGPKASSTPLCWPLTQAGPILPARPECNSRE